MSRPRRRTSQPEVPPEVPPEYADAYLAGFQRGYDGSVADEVDDPGTETPATRPPNVPEPAVPSTGEGEEPSETTDPPTDATLAEPTTGALPTSGYAPHLALEWTFEPAEEPSGRPSDPESSGAEAPSTHHSGADAPHDDTAGKTPRSPWVVLSVLVAVTLLLMVLAYFAGMAFSTLVNR